MKRFQVTVNGQSYDVSVEEMDGASTPVAAAPAAPAAAPAPTPAPAAAPAGEGDPVKAPMPGTVLDVKVSAGDKVSSGQVLLILEAMKMENEIVAPKDGTITSVVVKKSDTVNSDDVLVTIA